MGWRCSPPALFTKTMEYIRLENISKSFGEIVANDSISFAIEEGEVLSILGENGSGKSTIFKTILGFLKAKEGIVLLDNLDILSYDYDKELGFNKEEIESFLKTNSDFYKTSEDNKKIVLLKELTAVDLAQRHHNAMPFKVLDATVSGEVQSKLIEAYNGKNPKVLEKTK